LISRSIANSQRYAILLHRIQAPENTATPRPITSGTGTSPTDATGGGASGSTDEVVSFREHVGNMISANPIVKWAALALITLVLINVLRTPQVLPFMFFVMHSVWVPQIWRNARRGTARGLNPSFILGMSVARLALPLYGLGCPDNIFSLERADWVWALAAWVAVQVCILFAQDRFGPAFFLPKQFAPQQGYDYHPLIPSDPESVVGLGQGGSTCSICMEEVDVRGAGAGSAGAGSGTSADDASASSALLGMNARRSYAVAPCHHLFHTKCLQQWMAIKTICPLCKRPLPPL
jgi:hypothetical protein